ncbi:Integrin beta subunit tail [Trinorchestia longiramus]|nr:Integrin beta subunit tail [Trinorchestia longiramus]
MLPKSTLTTAACDKERCIRSSTSYRKRGRTIAGALLCDYGAWISTDCFSSLLSPLLSADYTRIVFEKIVDTLRTMKNTFIVKFCCWLFLATKINGEFSDSGVGIVLSGKRGLSGAGATKMIIQESPADHPVPALTQSQRREMKREVRRNRAAARRAVRERNRRQRMELRQHRQKPASSGSPALAAENGTNRSEMEWMKANLSSLWETVMVLQSNQLMLLQTSGRPHLGHHVKNETSQTVEPSHLTTVSPDCPPEVRGSECQTMTTSCMADAGAEPCSGRGQCCCGVCVCSARYYGHYCECSDHTCPWHEGKVCGEAGRCRCGQCTCMPGYTGEACECSLETSSCQDDDGVLCSNHGVCECGSCQCYDSHMGVRCEESLYSAGLCEQLKPCVLCKALGRALPQCRMCDHVTVQLSPELEPSQSLCRMVHSGCLLQYSYEVAEGSQYLVSAPARLIEDFKNC